MTDLSLSKSKSSSKKTGKEKATHHAHAQTAVSDSDTTDTDDFPHHALGAISHSDTSDVDEEEAKAYVAAAQEQFPAVRELITQTRARREAIGLSTLWNFDPTTGLVRTQSGG